MSIGVGCNDMSLIQQADIGVDLYVKRSDIVSGDMVIADYDTLAKLVFEQGPVIYANMYLAIIIQFQFSIIYGMVETTF